MALYKTPVRMTLKYCGELCSPSSGWMNFNLVSTENTRMNTATEKQNNSEEGKIKLIVFLVEQQN